MQSPRRPLESQQTAPTAKRIGERAEPLTEEDVEEKGFREGLDVEHTLMMFLK